MLLSLAELPMKDQSCLDRSWAKHGKNTYYTNIKVLCYNQNCTKQQNHL